MRAVRAVLIAVALGLTPSIAEACSLNLNVREGETEEQAAARIYRADQDRLWAESEVVFVGEVLSLRRTGDTFEVEVLPRGALKGDVEPEPITYLLDQSGLGCGFRSFPTVMWPGVFYANRSPDDEIQVEGMLNYEEIRDPALQARFNQQIDVMDAEAVATPDGSAATPSVARWLGYPIWLWLAGCAGASFILGLLLGRVGRSASKKK